MVPKGDDLWLHDGVTNDKFNSGYLPFSAPFIEPCQLMDGGELVPLQGQGMPQASARAYSGTYDLSIEVHWHQRNPRPLFKKQYCFSDCVKYN